MGHWYLQPILNSGAFVAAVAAALVLLLLVRPAYRRIGRRRQLALAGLRLLVCGLMVLAMLRPTHISRTTKRQTATVLILFDQTRSMQLPDTAAGRTRWQAQLDALRQVQPLLQELAKTLELRLYGYDSTLHPLAWDGPTLAFPEQPRGEMTDIGGSLNEALQREVGKRLAGVILLGDGVQTAFEPKVEIQEAGRTLGRLGYPLYTIGFGPLGDKSQSRDVAVENLEDQYTVFVKNELALRAVLAVRGYVNQPLNVELLVEKPDGQREVIGPRTLTAREDGQQLPIDISYTPDQIGRYKLTLQAAEQPGELVTKNNRLSAFLRVLEGGVKVLYLEGELRPEQKFLRRSLDAAADLEVDFEWLDHRHRDRWPVDLSAQLQDPRFDVFLLGDLDATALGDANMKLLRAAVERGRGLVLLGGYHSFGAGGYRETPLADVMPIKIDRLERQDFDAPIRADLHLSGDLPMVPVRSHPILNLAPDPENAAAWRQLPPLTGANKFFELKDSAGTTVLAETPDQHPLLIASEFGRGRVVTFAGDSTWRWWMRGQEVAHKRFWRQAILWLVRREDLEQNEVWVKLPQRRFFPGGRVTFTAGAKNAAREVIADAKLTARWSGGDQAPQELQLAREDEHWLGTIPSVDKPGDYKIEIVAEKDGRPLGTASSDFLVLDQDVELSNSAADYDQLTRLAALTKESGGRLVAAEQLPALLREIRDRPPEQEMEVQAKWQLADTAQDAWWFLVALVALLSGEWFLRKKWGLV